LDKIRTAKPPFTAWCQALAMAALGQNSFAARLPSALAVMATLIVLAIVLRRFAGPDRAFWTVFVLATSGVVIAWSALTSLTDARGARATAKALVAILIIAAIAGPWIYLVEKRAPGFLWTTASRDVVQRVFEPLEQHKGPPGYYLLVVWGIYFPWSVLLPLTLA